MAQIGIPVAGAISSAGTATLETLPAETFTWTGADITFAGTMPVATFKNAFELSEVNDDGAAELEVSMTAAGKVNFKAALLTLLNGGAKLVARDEDQEGFGRTLVAGTSTLEQYLTSFAQLQIDEDLASNNIPGNVEAEHVADLELTDFVDDASQGVADLWDDMDTANATSNLNIIARQIPTSRYGEAFSSELKVLANDVITVRFVISQSYVVSEEQGAATGVAGSAVGAYPGVGSGYGVAARNVDLKITLA